MKLPKVVNAILCEDIRMEFSGKFSLAGVFGSDMTVMGLPAPILCAVFAEMEPTESGVAQVEFRIVDDAGTELMKHPHQLVVESPQRQPLAFGPINFLVSTPGEIKIQWRTADSRWVTIKAFKIVLAAHSLVPGIPKGLVDELLRKLEQESKGKASST